MKTINKLLIKQIGGIAVINKIIEVFYDNMLTDYRINRFFNDSDKYEQSSALKAFILAICEGSNQKPDEIKVLLADFFLHAFARDKRKSFMAGSDWAFFGLIIEQNEPSTRLLCDTHAHLLWFMPDDFNYDALMENLSASLKQLNIDKKATDEVLKITESARKSVLGQ